MTARIYKPARTAMQSGTAKTKEWVLDYEPEQPRTVEPLMGWTSVGRHEAGSAAARSTPRKRRSPIASARAFPIRCSKRGRRCGNASPTPTISPIRAARPGRIDACRSRDRVRVQGRRCADRRGRSPSARRKLPALRGGALAQQRDEALFRHRLAEQESLPVVAAHADQRQRVGGFLDADADRDAAEIVREVDHGLAQRRVDLVGAAVGDESAVELELGERQFLEPRQRGIAAAEIVDRELDVEGPKLFGELVASARSVTICSSVTSMISARPFLELRPIGLHDVGDRDLDQRVDRNVDREPQIDAELGEAELGLEAPAPGPARRA